MPVFNYPMIIITISLVNVILALNIFVIVKRKTSLVGYIETLRFRSYARVNYSSGSNFFLRRECQRTEERERKKETIAKCGDARDAFLWAILPHDRVRDNSWFPCTRVHGSRG